MVSEKNDSAAAEHAERAETVAGRGSSAARWENEGGETIPATHGVSGDEPMRRAAARRSAVLQAVFGSGGVSGASMDDAAAGKALDALRGPRPKADRTQGGAE